jgi:hypothetical protein
VISELKVARVIQDFKGIKDLLEPKVLKVRKDTTEMKV